MAREIYSSDFKYPNRKWRFAHPRVGNPLVGKPQAFYIRADFVSLSTDAFGVLKGEEYSKLSANFINSTNSANPH